MTVIWSYYAVTPDNFQIFPHKTEIIPVISPECRRSVLMATSSWVRKGREPKSTAPSVLMLFNIPGLLPLSPLRRGEVCSFQYCYFFTHSTWSSLRIWIYWFCHRDGRFQLINVSDVSPGGMAAVTGGLYVLTLYMVLNASCFLFVRTSS